MSNQDPLSVAGPWAVTRPVALAEGISAGLAARERGSAMLPAGLPSPLLAESETPPSAPRASAARSPASPRAARRRLWQVDGRSLCGLLGLALSPAEARALAPKLRIDARDASDYVLHGQLINLAARSDSAGRRLARHLERKFAPAVERFAEARNLPALRAAWRTSLAAGHVADGYFALLTHPCLDEELAREAREAVHMYTHEAATELRRQRAELALLRAEHARWRDELEEARGARARQAARLNEQHRREAEREQQDAALAAARRRVAELEAALAETRSTRDLDTWREQQAVEQRARRAENEARLWKRLCLQARERLRAASGERARAAPARSGECTPPGSAPAPDLGGLTLAYIGGRTRLAPRLRALAERFNACLQCHDGGLQDHPTLLEAVVGRAAVVLCPLDCVSHDAALRLKRHCKQRGKRVVWLRSSSASSFARQLHLLAAREQEAAS